MPAQPQTPRTLRSEGFNIAKHCQTHNFLARDPRLRGERSDWLRNGPGGNVGMSLAMFSTRPGVMQFKKLEGRMQIVPGRDNFIRNNAHRVYIRLFIGEGGGFITGRFPTLRPFIVFGLKPPFL